MFVIIKNVKKKYEVGRRRERERRWVDEWNSV